MLLNMKGAVSGIGGGKKQPHDSDVAEAISVPIIFSFLQRVSSLSCFATHPFVIAAVF